MNINNDTPAMPDKADSQRPAPGDKLFYFCLTVMLVLWGAVVWWWSSPSSLVSDWHGWRQADTQAIALNFYHQGMNIFYPQIDWGGDGPGYVQTEFQLFAALICVGFWLFGVGIWQGQLISLLSLIGAGTYIALLARRHFNDFAVLAGTLAYLSCLGTLHLATAVQPDALCFFFYCASMYYFARFVDHQSGGWLLAAFVCSALAVLVKSPALHLGIVQFLWVVFAAPQLLRKRILWLHWLGILLVLGAYYVHSYTLFDTYGNTFGIGVGGDSKFPSVNDLLNPRKYYNIASESQVWGLTRLGILAGVFLLLTRRLNAFEWAATLGIGAMLVVAMRYTSFIWFGSHYHIFAVLLGAYMITHVINDAFSLRPTLGWTLLVAVVAALLYTFPATMHSRIHHSEFTDGQKYEAFAREIAAFVEPGDLIMVRANAPAIVEGWQGGPNNFEDPRLFYLTSTKGWVVPLDLDDPQTLLDYFRRGAKVYAHPEMPMSPIIGEWLKVNATLLSKSVHGEVYGLPGKSSSGGG